MFQLQAEHRHAAELMHLLCKGGVYSLFLNQTRAGHRPARTWFLEITLMRTSVCVCGMCVRVCVSAPPRLLKTSGVM